MWKAKRGFSGKWEFWWPQPCPKKGEVNALEMVFLKGPFQSGNIQNPNVAPWKTQFKEGLRPLSSNSKPLIWGTFPKQ